MKFPHGYRLADIAATYGENVLVARDRHNSLYNAYTILVKERADNFADFPSYVWAVYAEDLDYNDATHAAAYCARINREYGGRPESGYEV